MEHEIFVPFSATVVRAALAEPERVARCVPGLSREPRDDVAALGGRLRLRIGSSTITYRGTLRLGESGEGITVDAEGSEARGNGSAQLRLTVVPRPVADGSGTTLAFSGRVAATGRVTEFGARQQHSAGRRLLDRFTEALVAELSTAEPAALGRPDDDEPVIPGIPAPDSGGEDATSAATTPEGTDGSGADIGDETLARGDQDDVFAAEGPPSSLDPDDEPADESAPGAPDAPDAVGPGDGDAVAGALPPRDTVGAEDGRAPGGAPEADLARRTMIGRSAEEVDHAPPRGRYAPREATGFGMETRTPLRWAAPIAVAAVVGAVTVTRLLRRRR